MSETYSSSGMFLLKRLRANLSTLLAKSAPYLVFSFEMKVVWALDVLIFSRSFFSSSLLLRIVVRCPGLDVSNLGILVPLAVSGLLT